MARSRQREEGPPLARFLRGNVSTKGRRDCPLDFLHVGGGILPPCPTADAPRLRSSRSPRASILSPIYRSTDETPPETSQPPYGKACGPPSGAPDESPQQKGRSLYGSVPCSFIGCFPSPRFQPDETHWEKDEKRKEGPFPASGKDGSPQKYISYDVGGTMGSPYIFQVSGR